MLIEVKLVSSVDWLQIKQQIMNIEKIVFGDKAETEQELAEAFENPASICVVLKNGQKIIGYNLAVDPEPEEESIHISITAILPEFQGQGLVSELLKLTCEEAKKRGIKYFTTTARVAFADKIKKNYEIIEEMLPEENGLGLQQDLKFKIP